MLGIRYVPLIKKSIQIVDRPMFFILFSPNNFNRSSLHKNRRISKKHDIFMKYLFTDICSFTYKICKNKKT